MTHYPAPRTRSASIRPIVIIPNQYALFGQTGLVPPTRTWKTSRSTDVQPMAKPAVDAPEKDTEGFSLCPNTVKLPIGNAAKLRANLSAIETLKLIRQQQRPATAAEKEILTQYTGWGGLSGVWKAIEFEQWQQNQLDPTAPLDESVSRWGSQYGRTRQRLTELLTAAEQTAAEASTLNAFFTSPDVVAAIWRAVDELGFTGGRILEPAAGIGYFIGMMPPSIRERSAWVAVEKDHLSGGILQLLYPDVKTHVCGLEQTDLEAGSFDLVIGNVPFGGYTVYDRHHPELSSFAIHNYFIGRSAQLVKPGGIVALVTSMGTLDATGPEFRQFLTIEADTELVGAIRLPSNAFEASSGTQVTTDVLFLRKRSGRVRTGAAHAFERTVTLRAEATDEDMVRTLAVNEYYHANPAMMLGEMRFADEVNKGGLYRADQPTLYQPNPDQLPQLLAAAIDKLPKGVFDKTAVLTGKPTRAEQNAAQRFTDSVTIRGKRYSQTLIITQYERVRKAFSQLREAEKEGRGEAHTDDLRIELN